MAKTENKKPEETKTEEKTAQEPRSQGDETKTTTKKKIVPERVSITGQELDILQRKNSTEYKKVCEALAQQTKRELLARLNSSTQYPIDTVRQWRMIIHAINTGRWHPTTPKLGTWKPPRRMTPYDKFMNS